MLNDGGWFLKMLISLHFGQLKFLKHQKQFHLVIKICLEAQFLFDEKLRGDCETLWTGEYKYIHLPL